MNVRDYLSPLPLIAVLRGITPDEIDAVADALGAEGFRILEVPLNSPRPFESIRRLAQRHGERCLVGAGTVLDPADVVRVRDAGGRLIVMPHADTAVIDEAKRVGLVCLPGVATPTEAFAALAAGADGLKLFPAEAMVPATLRAWRAVLPKSTLVFAVGGIRPDNMGPWWAEGAAGFGTGSNLYRPGADISHVRAAAAAYAAAFHALPERGWKA
jgi:2-dehydro-3-deoxyphosphogalactonate aldolase